MNCAKCGKPGADQLNADAWPGVLCKECLPPPTLCDFCRTPERVWFYPASEFSFLSPMPGVPILISTGAGWDACQDCHKLIERQDYEALARKAQNYPRCREELVFMLEFFKAFFLARIGPSERI